MVAEVCVLDRARGSRSRRRARGGTLDNRPACAHLSSSNQPDGVPPLALTGERTLPDLPEENYWFRRHLAVYEWIAPRVAGLRVADLACGEGYGADVLARCRARGGRGGREPRGPRARPPSLPARQPALRARAGRGVRGPVRRDRLPADDRARPRARAPVGAVRPGRPDLLRDDPQSAHPGPARGREVRQPLAPSRVLARPVPGAPGAPTSRGSSCSGSTTRASCASTSWRFGSAGTGSTARFGSRSRSTIASCRRSRRRTSSCAPIATSTARSTCSLSATGEAPRTASSAIWRSSCTRTCPTSRASGPTRSARSGCSTRSPAPTCPCWSGRAT